MLLVHGVAKVGHDLAATTTPTIISLIIKCAGDYSQSFVEISSLNQATLGLVLLSFPFER